MLKFLVDFLENGGITNINVILIRNPDLLRKEDEDEYTFFFPG